MGPGGQVKKTGEHRSKIEKQKNKCWSLEPHFEHCFSNFNTTLRGHKQRAAQQERQLKASNASNRILSSYFYNFQLLKSDLQLTSITSKILKIFYMNFQFSSFLHRTNPNHRILKSFVDLLALPTSFQIFYQFVIF